MNDIMKDVLNLKVEPTVVSFKMLSYNVWALWKRIPYLPNPTHPPHNRLKNWHHRRASPWRVCFVLLTDGYVKRSFESLYVTMYTVSDWMLDFRNFRQNAQNCATYMNKIEGVSQLQEGNEHIIFWNLFL